MSPDSSRSLSTMARSFVATVLPPSVRPLLASARRLVQRAPGPIADRITHVARTTRDRRRDEHRASFGDDAAYFDHLVEQAIEGRR